MSFQIERRGYTKITDLMVAIINDMKLNGFTMLYPTTYNAASSKSVIMQAGADVDPLAATQPWCIKFQWDKDAAGNTITETTNGGKLDVIVATPAQFVLSTGVAASFLRSTSGLATSVEDTRDVIGLLGSATMRTAAQGATTYDSGYPDRTFIDRTRLHINATTGDDTLAFPMAYRISISPRGVALMVWEIASDQSANRYSWFVVQRPVDNVTGAVVVDGKAPVHCVYGLMKLAPNTPWTDTGSYNIRRFVVREADIGVPSPLGPVGVTTGTNVLMGVDATINTVDYAAIMNASQQVAITEGNKYVITFPNGLNTARYAYTHELDMIAYTSADVVSQGSEVPVTVYGEQTPRKYLALNANGAGNTGMRLLFLVDGGGISTPAQGA